MYDWKSFLKNKYFIIKFGVSVLLVGLAFRLLYDRSYDLPPTIDTPFLQDNQISARPSISGDSQENTEYLTEPIYSEGKCNLFSGDWVPYKNEPLYTNSTCKFIEDHQNCMRNGRPDTGYLHWRWKPYGCELPRLDSLKFLEFMRNKTWAFIGDSIARNHVQSFLCILSVVEDATEVYHDKQYKSRRWVFPSYNFTVSVIWSPMLADATIFEDMNGISTSEIELHLDRFDKSWIDLYSSLDYMVLSTGKWFTKSTIFHENTTVLGCHHCDTRNLTELGFKDAFRKVLTNVLDFIIASNHKGMIFYRTSAPDHFEDGEWFSGGTCKRKTPAKEGEFQPNILDRIIREIEVEELQKAANKASEKGVRLKIFDVLPLSLLRPDGHPGPYRFFQPFAEGKNTTGLINDCLHWCLPGPIDFWNDLLVEMVMNG